jgi:hypothetical protein
MSEKIAYTLEVYKLDRRTKDGVKLKEKIDYDPCWPVEMNSVVEGYVKLGFLVKIFETYITEKNLLTGELYQERYDTPHFCSPSNESFWSM